MSSSSSHDASHRTVSSQLDCGSYRRRSAWLGGQISSLVAYRDPARPIFGSNAFAAWCSESGCPGRIGKACLKALPDIEASKASLRRLVLGDLRVAGGDCSSASALAQAVREQSRDDFRAGRIMTVDGWMLSLTETRVYALAALPQQHGSIA